MKTRSRVLATSSMLAGIACAGCFQTPPDVAHDAGVDGAAPDASIVPHGVHGTVTGLWGQGADLELTLTADGYPTEVLTVPQNGDYAFATRPVTGTAYTVAITTTPPYHQCQIASGSGQVGAGDIVADVTCTDAIDLSLVLSNPWQYATAQGETSATFSFSVLQQYSELGAIGLPGITCGQGTITFHTPDAGGPIGMSFPHFNSVPSSTALIPCTYQGMTRSFFLTFDRAADMATQSKYEKALLLDAGDQLGASVTTFYAQSQRFVAVGAPFEDSSNAYGNNARTDSGAVYVFDTSQPDALQTAVLKAAQPAVGDEFGNALAHGAVGNATALGVAAVGDDTLGTDAGAAYVFHEDASGWVQDVKLTASDGAAGDAFGTSIAIGGGVVAVGAPLRAGGGAVYVYRQSNQGVWSQDPVITAPNAGTGDEFGWRVAAGWDPSTSSEILAVGAPLEDGSTTGIQATASTDDNAADSGAVYLFRHPTGGSWELVAYVKSANSSTLDEFGSSLFLENVPYLGQEETRLIVGAPGDSVAGSAGAAYVYDYATTWTASGVLTTTGVTGFGSAVACNGDLAAVSSTSGAGRVDLFRKTATTGWQLAQSVTAENAEVGDRFGAAIDMTGQQLAVGATGEDSDNIDTPSSNAAQDSGALYLFH